MKKASFLVGFLIMTLFIYAQNNLVVGRIVKGQPILTANADMLCKALSRNLASQSNIIAAFTSVELVQDSTSYLLIFHGGIYKTTFRGTADGNMIISVNPKASCTTSDSDCARDPNGCVPAAGVGCACTACPANAVCTKTCSTMSLLQ